MITTKHAIALKWKYPDADISTMNGVITFWNHPTEKEPKKAAADKVLKEYEKYEAAQEYKQKRANEYPPIGDQLDAILKGFNQLRLNGTDMPDDLDAVLNQWLAVKKKHPKPKDK